jgi:hypothetical protein
MVFLAEVISEVRECEVKVPGRREHVQRQEELTKSQWNWISKEFRKGSVQNSRGCQRLDQMRPHQVAHSLKCDSHQVKNLGNLNVHHWGYCNKLQYNDVKE